MKFKAINGFKPSNAGLILLLKFQLACSSLDSFLKGNRPNLDLAPYRPARLSLFPSSISLPLALPLLFQMKTYGVIYVSQLTSFSPAQFK